MSQLAAAAVQDEMAFEKRRYPIGRFEFGQSYSESEIQKMIETIEAFPARLKKLVAGMKEAQLDTTYRNHGWTVRQVVHHVADSHINAYMRLKLGLTEDHPTIKPYNEKAWAELVDSKTLPIDASLKILEGIHHRWTKILRTMDAESFHRTFFHPEHMKMHTLIELTALYSWHCNHHYEHINLVKSEMVAKPAKKSSVKTSSAKPSKKKSSK